MTWQLMIVGFGSLAASTPYLAIVLGGIIFAWLGAAKSLAGQFDAAMVDMEEAAEATAEPSAPTATPPGTPTSSDLFEKAKDVLPLDLPARPGADAPQLDTPPQ